MLSAASAAVVVAAAVATRSAVAEGLKTGKAEAVEGAQAG
jgi:hypothetical protein